MATGDTLEVRFYHKTAQGSIWIQLCNYNLCNIISLFGSTPDGELGFDAWAECKEDGRECTHHIGSGHPLGMEPFPEGDHVFRLQRRASDMLVSLRTHPQRAVTLIAGDSNTIVLVRPQFLNSTVVEEVLFERVGKNIALHAG
ncbi:hypothetical protein ONE63_009565 [Megalurothrips usitatus]|uniref:Galectin n=1 Tax=Megalurothrips usitatus TaxID=439358 RepID=A0AAV7XRV1_9NEOP|nr:hypothetical protein ONE63_009565 [Megalurothrips usitatus]